MSFYQELSRYYDEIFAVDDNEMRFIRDLLQGRKHILDIGCGTGNKTVYFSTEHNSVIGIDLDEGMIARAKAANADSGRDIRYAVVNMLEIDNVFAGLRFDGILCLGNTLVHLPSPAAIKNMLGKVHGLLSSDGVFVLQILNYDRIIEQKVNALPVIDTPNTRFLRRYAWEQGEMHFVTTLEIKNTGQTLHNDIVLYPLRKRELTDMLAAAGFTATDYFGSCQGAPHQNDSFVTIAVCGAISRKLSTTLL